MSRLITLCPIVALSLAACGAPPASATAQPTLAPQTLAVVVPTATEQCGPEAAIALAQTQSDLALAAVAEVEAVANNTGNPTAVAQTGRHAFSAALELMKAYDVPECLLMGKVFAARFFEERVAAYQALEIGDEGSYSTHLTNGEIARQNMILAVNELLQP